VSLTQEKKTEKEKKTVEKEKKTEKEKKSTTETSVHTKTRKINKPGRFALSSQTPGPDTPVPRTLREAQKSEFWDLPESNRRGGKSTGRKGDMGVCGEKGNPGR